MRGNMLTLIGSLGVVGLLVVGFALAIEYTQVDLMNTITAGALLSIAAFLKVTDYLSPVLSYFGLLWSDVVERGTLVEISPSFGGLGYNTGYSLTGCVLDITPTHVHLLCTKPYVTLGNQLGTDKFLDTSGKITSVTAYAASNTNSSTYAANMYGGTSSVQQNKQPQRMNNVGGKEVVRDDKNDKDEMSAKAYIERDFLKTKMVVSISTTAFVNSNIARLVSWVPVINLQRVNTFKVKVGDK